MHRSGTSAVTRVINLLGASIATDLIGAEFSHACNSKGFWESWDVNTLHEDLLASIGSSWDDWTYIAKFTERAEWESDWVERILALLQHQHRDDSLFVVKDPRICRFVPLWLNALRSLPVEPLAVIPLRNPIEVARSLRTRDGFPFGKSYLIWLRHVLDAELHTRGIRRTFARYEDLLSNWSEEAARIAQELGIEWKQKPEQVQNEVDDFLASDLRHHVSTQHELEVRSDVIDWVRKTFAAMDALLEGGDTETSYRQLDEVRAEFNYACQAFGGAVSGERAAFTEACQSFDAKLSGVETKFDGLGKTVEGLDEETLTLASNVKQLMRRTELLTAEIDALKRESLLERLRRWLDDRRRLRSDCRFLAASGLFDKDWYLRQYPDIREAKLDPITHYLQCGASEGRDPSPDFSTWQYLRDNPDISPSRVNPLVHFARWCEASDPDGSDVNGLADRSLDKATYEPEQRPDLNAASKSSLPKLIAFYLPQFHPIPENDQWWGKGFTEWTNVTKAQPKFDGHHQPQLPDELGFYDLRLPEVMQRQVELAKQYGIAAFCFHYYWFGGQRLLEKPLDIFLDHPEWDLSFCLNWANENWTRRWDGSEQELLIGQQHSPEDDIACVEDLQRYMNDPRYVRVDGKPLVLIYRADVLPEPEATAERWREACQAAGMGDIMLVACQTFGIQDPRPLGFDAAVEYPPHNVDVPAVQQVVRGRSPDFRGTILDYAKNVQAMFPRTEEYRVFRTVFPGWDNTARRNDESVVFANGTPQLYAEWLDQAIAHTVAHHAPEEQIVFINAWNEWAEGAHLEPDSKWGYAYLNATARVLRKYATSVSPESASNTYLIADETTSLDPAA